MPIRHNPNQYNTYWNTNAEATVGGYRYRSRLKFSASIPMHIICYFLLLKQKNVTDDEWKTKRWILQQQIAFPKTSSGQAVPRKNELHHTSTQGIYKPQHKHAFKYQCLTQSNATAQSYNPNDNSQSRFFRR